MLTIGKYVRDLRKQADITQKELSALSGVPQSSISDVEKDQRDISAVSLYRISKALGVHICSFFGESSLHDGQNKSLDIFSDLTPKQIDILNQLSDQFRQAAFECRKAIEGDAAAGPPIYSPNLDGASIPIPEKYLDSRFFVVMARGDSMHPRIKDGDYVVIQKDTPGEIGDIVLARIDGTSENEYMIKRLHKKSNIIEFYSINPIYKPVKFNYSNVLSIEKVVHIIHK